MRWSIAIAIFKKEILETLRDRRTLVVMLLLPLLLYPTLMVLMTQIFTRQMAQIEKRSASIMVLGEAPDELKAMLEKMEQVELIFQAPDPLMPTEITIDEPVADDPENPLELRTPREPEQVRSWARGQLQANRAQVVLVLPSNLAELIDDGNSAGVLIYYDQTNHVSNAASQRVFELLVRWERRIRVARDHDQGLHGYTDPLVPEMYSTASAEERGGFLAGQILPVMLMIMVMLGAFYPAIDLTAGEKERGTMQTLMTAPAEAVEIIVGKFATVVVVSMISAGANIVSMALAFMWILGAQSPDGQAMALTVDLSTIVIALAQLLPISVFFSAVMLTIAVFAQSFKEAQNYLSPAYMIVILPALAGAMPGVELTPITALAPGLNFVLLIREMLTGSPAIELIGAVLLANVVYAMLAIAVAVRIFQNEEILLGGPTKGSWKEVFRTRKNGVLVPTPVTSLAAFAVGMLLFLYIGQMAQSRDIIIGMLVTQWLLLLVPVFLWLKPLGVPLRDTLQLGAPPARMWLGAILIGLSAWASFAPAINFLQQFIIPENPELEEQMRRLLGLDEKSIPLYLMLFAFAVSPGICEEFFFRGLILGGFRRNLSRWNSIIFCGVLFGLLHLDPARIIPTGLLGVLIAYVAVRGRSIWPCILIHVLHNGITITAVHTNFMGLAEKDATPNFLLMGVATVLFIAGLAITIGKPSQPDGIPAATPTAPTPKAE